MEDLTPAAQPWSLKRNPAKPCYGVTQKGQILSRRAFWAVKRCTKNEPSQPSCHGMAIINTK